MMHHPAPSTLQARIDRAAAKLAALKAQQQAIDAREKARLAGEIRATRNRTLVLWGVALEREALNASEGIDAIRAILEMNLMRDGERTAALSFLDSISPVMAAAAHSPAAPQPEPEADSGFSRNYSG